MNQYLSQKESECLRDLKRAAEMLEVQVIVIGASARQLVFDVPNRISPYRTTLDWDFGVRVASWEVFHTLRQHLAHEPGSLFSCGSRPHRLVHRNTGIQVDLVPFGGLEQDGRIRWPEDSHEMNVVGFTDAFANAVAVPIAADTTIKVATAPLLMTLKFFAFGDRGHMTDRDINDIWHVIRHLPIAGDESRLLDEVFPEGFDEAFDWEYAGATLLGFDIGRACEPSTIERLRPLVRGLAEPYSTKLYPLLRKAATDDEEKRDRTRIAQTFHWLLEGITRGQKRLRMA